MLKFSVQFRRLLILNRLTLIGFLTVNCSNSRKREEYGDDDSNEISVYGFSSSTLMTLSDSVFLTLPRTANKEKRHMLQKSMHQMLQPLSEFEEKGFSVEDRSTKLSRCLSALVLCCCKIPEGKNMSTVLYGLPFSVRVCSVRFLIMISNIFGTVSLET